MPASQSGTAGLSDIASRRAERRRAVGRRSDDRWQAIQEAASVVFRRLGYSQATLEEIAMEVGVNRASLYYYVGTKEELLIALLYQPVHEMTANLAAIVALDLSPEAKFRQALERFAKDMEQTPELFVFLAENLHQVMTGREAADIAANAHRYAKLFDGIIEDGVRTGVFRDDVEPEFCTHAILGMFNWIHRWFDPSGERSLREICADFTELAFAAVSAPARPVASKQ